MKRVILLIAILFFSTRSNAQKLSFEQLEKMFNSSIDDAEEQLFLVGYPFISKTILPDSAGVVYNFSNRKNTIATSKKVSKNVYYKTPTKSQLQYITYERAEFQRLRKLMIDEQFTRSSKDSISENATYSKNALTVRFEVRTDKYENKVYTITFQGVRSALVNKIPNKINLKGIFK